MIKRNIDRTAGRVQTGWSWRYSLARGGGYRPLFADLFYDGGSGEVIQHTAVALGGGYVAESETLEQGGSRYGCSLAVKVYNLSTGRAKGVFLTDCGAHIQPLVVSSRGFAAWHLSRSLTLHSTISIRPPTR